MLEIPVTGYVLLGSLPLIYAVQLFLDFRRALKSIHNFPGFRLLLSPATILANLTALQIPLITLGNTHGMTKKYEDFKNYNSDIISLVSLWPRARLMFWIADAEVAKEITSWRARWPKPTEQYGAINLFGRNIVTTEGNEWKKHRKIANPAFSEPNNKLVWEEAVRITMDMIDNVWDNRGVVDIENAVDITLPLALFVIGSAGFGRTISFAEDLQVPPGHVMPFKDALHIVSEYMIYTAVVPRQVLFFNEKVRKIRNAFYELHKYMQEMINERRSAEKQVDRHDLFTNLLYANLDEEDSVDARLLDSELIGDIFIFLLAGHETTAHTLCFTLGLLAMYPDEQEILYQHILSVLPDGRLPTYEDMNRLNYVTAVFHETLRLFPPVTTIPKSSAEDTSLTTTNSNGDKINVPIPKDSDIIIYTAGIHYNPRYWKDPHEFKPKRFLENWPRDAFLPFSGGARSCIGRRFSEAEATAILAVLLARYKVEVKEEPQYVSETFEERYKRIFQVKIGVTTTPIRLPLVFKRR